MNSAQDNSLRRKRLPLRQLVGVGISIACLVLVFRKVDVAQLRIALENFKWHFLALGIASLAIDYAVRIQRWAVLLRAGEANVTGWACAAPFLGSITLNNVLPFRAGDLVRALLFPAAIGVRRVTATASLLLERLIDMLTLLMSLGIGLSLSPVAHVPEWLGHTVTGLAIGGCVTLFLIAVLNGPLLRLLASLRAIADRRGLLKVGSGIALLIELTRDAAGMSRPRVLGALALLSAVIWVGETGLFWAVLHGLSIDAAFPAALTIMAIATLSTLVPSSPGYVGPFHLAAYSAAVMLGGSSAQAASFAVLAHLGLWLPTTLAGSIAILAKPALFKGRSAVHPTA
ncbi:flippase-like domain-containing protein [Trinickia sp. LjRoot230]|uniref:lysylphosphatidylglycerol synthase transmembrane domain-containing protein n=1 Tax=Trinickia sp. LjRoot230 TaxID=3342288 RepID=UPI003ECC2CBF